MSLLKERKSYKPFDYPWAHEAFITQNEMHWLPSEVDLGHDKVDWEENLNPSEKALLTNILRYFTQSDIDVNDGYLGKYAKIFHPVEVRMMMSAFANMEAIHIHAYSNLVDTLGMDDKFYTEFLDYKEMAAKHDFLSRFSVDNVQDIAKTVAMYSAFTEGLQLFASFAILFNFQRPEGGGRMRGMGKIVEWSIRDETLHVQSMTKLFREFVKENKDQIDLEEVKRDVIEVCKTTIKLEDDFTDLCFGVSPDIRGLKKEELKEYVRFIADYRMKQLGFDPIFNIKKNPLEWMEELVMPRHTNFFENRVTEYAKGATKGDWGDLEFEG